MEMKSEKESAAKVGLDDLFDLAVISTNITVWDAEKDYDAGSHKLFKKKHNVC